MRGLLCRWLLAAWLGVLVFNAPAASTNSSWLLRTWQSDDGLPNNSITALAQTTDGYVWAANPTRLSRFDGVRFENFSSKTVTGGRSGKIGALVPSRQGGLWLGMENGAVAYISSGPPQLYTNDLPKLTARSMVEDTEGALWIAYNNGPTCRIKNGEITQFDADDGLPEGRFNSVAMDNRGRIWFARAGQVGILREGRFETLFRFGNRKTRLTGASSGGVWIGSGCRLFKGDENNNLEDLGEFAPEHPGAGPSVMIDDRNGGVWIGTHDNGLFRYDDSGFEKVATSHVDILSLIQDREGHIWAGTAGGGVNYIARRYVELSAVDTELPSGIVQSLCEDASGAIWAATSTGMLLSRSEGVWRNLSTETNWPGGNAMCVAADAFGGVWIGTGSEALHHWHEGRFTTYGKAQGLIPRSIFALHASRSGDVWLAGTHGILQRLSCGGFTTFEPPEPAHYPTLTEDAAGNIWAGSSRGTLLRITGDEIVDETGLLKEGPKSIRVLYGTPDGILWIGYAGGGVGRLKDGKLARITYMEGLHGNHISQIVADANGWMWFGADHGIFKVWSGVLADVAEGRDTGLQSIHYGRGEGLPSLQANFGVSPAALRTRDGRVWMSMLTSLVVVNPRTIQEDLNAPTIYVKRVTVDDHTVSYDSGIVPKPIAMTAGKPKASFKLKPDHHRIEIDYTALSFRSPDNVQFRHMLEGFDKEWRWVKNQRTASYSRLPAGDYCFRVAGCNGDGTWNEVGTAIAFTVAPFVWQTWWFRLSVIAGFTGLIAGIVRYVSFRRLRLKLQVLERQAALDKERTRIARDIHDDVGSRLTKIVLLSELTLQRPATQDQTRERAKQVSSAARQVMKSLDEAVWAINPRNDTVRDFVDYTSEFAAEFLQAAGIRCRVELPHLMPERTVSADVRHNLFLATKEALHNVARHAQATEAWLRVQIPNGSLRVIIEDNGQGFESAPADACADGLRNMQQRLEEIGGQCDVESRPGTGTRISFLYHWPHTG